ncbi:N-formylglutamate amidohydrolase [Sphingomonas sp. PB2P19]|uniref:N-formylglutamate amidohydrolase n=1 Tax=Sphingomonas rhamnosi TaxID=3096156 RepID=UPI002FC68587
MPQTPSFTRTGALPPASPVVMSVPHAGRDYPAALRQALRVPLATVLPLEDRHIDAVARAARTVETLIVQDRARAWIDLNRSEDERDPKVDEGAPPRALVHQSAKLRSGLGLVPRRASGAGDLWGRRFADADVMRRIADDHRPYHAALSQALAAARTRFGVAVLLDVHSMPPLGTPGSAARIVLGDRFGHSADARFVARLEAEGTGSGHATALNAPYAGGHILERHADPAGGIHAIQLEFDRSLYLDRRLDAPGTGFADTAALLGRMLAALADEALGTPIAAAAE